MENNLAKIHLLIRLLHPMI